MAKVIIFQLPIEHINKFRGSEMQFDRWAYKKVYQCERENGYNEDDAFEEFNINHPDDYHANSLSVGDIVRIDDVEFFCDHFGWKTVVNEKLM